MKYTKIKEIELNNGEKLSIAANDIVIIVGPNNAGKSQILKDIHTLLVEDNKGVVVKSITYEAGNREELINDIKENSTFENGTYLGYGYSIMSSSLDINSTRFSRGLRDYLVSFLKTEHRLGIVEPPSAIDKEERKTHPIHYVVYNKEYQSSLSEYFVKAFGVDIFPRYTSKKKVPLLLGKVPKIEEPGTAPEIMDKFDKLFEECDRVELQGDGIRSFTGIILNLILKNYGIYLVDEPESFLHAPQAKIMGNVIANLLGDDRQAIISTHSEEIIKGLLEKGSERVKIIRVTRNGNNNSIALLDNDKVKELWKDNFLRQSNVLASLFHKNVVLSESDSDTRFYSMVLEHIKGKNKRSSETLFLFCSGKERLNSVVQSLRKLTVDFRCVTDIDVLNNPNTIQQLYESCGGVWSEDIQKKYNIFSSSLTNGKDKTSKEDFIANVKNELKKIDGDTLRNKDIKELLKNLLLPNKWDNLKQFGYNAIPAGDGQTAFDELINSFISYNLFIVKEGELECFIRTVGGHGPKWVDNVLAKYPDFDDPIYESVTKFVSSWNI